MELTCPKCQGSMRTYERSGITVDQCTECRGIFLDRGELERLVDAEAAFNEAPAAAPPAREPSYGSPPPAYGTPAGYQRRRRRTSSRRVSARRAPLRRRPPVRLGDRDYYKRKKRKSFMEELFD